MSLALLLGWSLLQTATYARAANTEPAQLAPETSMAWLEVSQPELILDQIFSRVAAYPGAMEAYLGDAKLGELKGAVKLFEIRLGMKWDQALRELTAGGVYLAIDPANKTNVLMIRAKSRRFSGKNSTPLWSISPSSMPRPNKSPLGIQVQRLQRHQSLFDR